MKAHSLKLATVALALCAVLMLAVPAAHAALGSALPALPHGGLIEAAMQATLAITFLRSQHTDLMTRATALADQITDSTAPDEVRRIEGEHDALVAQAEVLQRQISEAEAEEAARSATQPATGDAAVVAERRRAATIRDVGRRAALDDAVIQTAIDTGATVEAFRAQAFDGLVTRQNTAPTASVNASITRDETETRRRAMAGALVARLARASGERNVQIPEMSRAYGEMGFAEMAAETIGWRGHLRTPAQVIEVFQRAFHSTSDFPGIFSDALNTRLLARYQTAMPTYRLFAAPYMATDFRTINVVRAGDFPSPQRIPETGEIPAGTFGESKEQLTVHPYGVRMNITRQMIVNDNLGAIDQMLGSYGDTILGWENDLVFELLVSNSYTGPTLLTDSVVMFHTSHGNETASGTAISLASVGAGRAQMMKQTSINGRKLNLQPSLVLTGPDRLTEAEQLTATINPALIASAQTDWIKRLRPAGDANITGDHWYLFADPSVAPAFVYGTLQGFEGPRISTDDPFTVQGISVKVEHDFGAAGVDYRGATHNEGAPPA
jgi:hypothetical protein